MLFHRCLPTAALFLTLGCAAVSSDLTMSPIEELPADAGRSGPRRDAGPVNAGPDLPVAGRFHVDGTKIIDPDGKPFVAKGVNVNGRGWGWPGSVIKDVSKIVDCWKFNLIRVNSRLLPTEPGKARWSDNDDLDAIIRTFTSRRVVVMLEAHDKTGKYYTGPDLDALVAFHRDFASRYRNNPYVWFDVANEPGGETPEPAAWLAQHRAVIRAIRDEAAAPNLIIVEGWAWGQDTGAWTTKPVETSKSALLSLGPDVKRFDGKSYDDIVFNIHVYDQWKFGAPRIVDYLDRVAAAGHAIFIGEYGVENAGKDTTPATQALLPVVRERGIGRVAWAWWGGDDNDLTTSGNGGGQHLAGGCEQPTNLSPFGQMVWDDLRAP